MICRLIGAKPLSEQCWNIVNWTIGNKLQWNLNRNLYIVIQENAFEIVVWKMAAILSRPQCVNSAYLQDSYPELYVHKATSSDNMETYTHVSPSHCDWAHSSYMYIVCAVIKVMYLYKTSLYLHDKIMHTRNVHIRTDGPFHEHCWMLGIKDKL